MRNGRKEPARLERQAGAGGQFAPRLLARPAAKVGQHGKEDEYADYEQEWQERRDRQSEI